MHTRLPKAAEKLHRLLDHPDAASLPVCLRTHSSHTLERTANIQVLCLGNKIDRTSALSADRVRATLGLPHGALLARQPGARGNGACQPRAKLGGNSLAQASSLLGVLHLMRPALKAWAASSAVKGFSSSMALAQGLAALAGSCSTAHSTVQPLLNGLKGVAMRCRGVNPDRPIALFMCSVLKRAGYFEGMAWLAQHILEGQYS